MSQGLQGRSATAHLSHEEGVPRLEGDELVEVEEDVEERARQMTVLLQVPQGEAPLGAARAWAPFSPACASSGNEGLSAERPGSVGT